MRILLLLFCLAFATPAVGDEVVQWTAMALVPGGVEFPANMLEATHPVYAGPGAGAFPYLVPDDRWLFVSDINFGSKHVLSRASYFVLTCSCAPGAQTIVPALLTVPSTSGALNFRLPVMIPPGSTISAWFINNSNENQWMNVIMLGVLVPVPVPAATTGGRGDGR